MAKAVPIELHAGMPFAEAAALVVRVRTGEVFAGIDGVLDLRDIERVHAMRVATRRLRAALEIFAPCFPKKAHRAVLRDVKRLADALGERRDPDVHLDEVGDLADELGIGDAAGVRGFLGELRVAQATGNAGLAAALDAARGEQLASRLLALAERAR